MAREYIRDEVALALHNEKHTVFRYVCPNCLHTFLDKSRQQDKFCWECGEGLIVIP